MVACVCIDVVVCLRIIMSLVRRDFDVVCVFDCVCGCVMCVFGLCCFVVFGCVSGCVVACWCAHLLDCVVVCGDVLCVCMSV